MLVLAAVASLANAAQAQDIEINDTNFPDENFRNCVLAQNYGADAILTDEEIAAVTKIDVSNKNIANLKGIEHFTALTMLLCYNNQLTALDVSKNTALKTLYCDNNQLTTLDVSANNALDYLASENNQLTTLDVSKNTMLKTLRCNGNQLTAINLTANTALTGLYCFNNKLTALDVSKNTKLTILDCHNNSLSTLDVMANTALQGFACENNLLTTLVVSKNTALRTLNCSNNQLTTLDVSANTQLTKLYCNSNQLTALDVSKNIALMTLECYSNQIQGNEMLALVNRLPSVTSGEFYVVDTKDSKEKNSITKAQVAIAAGKNWTVYDYNRNNKVEYAGDPGIEINETNFPDNNFRNHVSTSYDSDSDNYLSYEEVAAVTNIDVSNKNIADLKGIEHFTALTSLSCYSNGLTTLDVSKNTALRVLNCGSNQLTTLDVSANTALRGLNCGSNQLTTLDVSNCTTLTTLYCFSNQIQADEMLALVNSLPTVTNGRFYVVDTHDSNEGNVITKAQVAIAQSKGWTVYDFDFKGQNVVEYAGDPGIEINETNFPDNNFRSYVSTSYDTDSDGYLSYEEIAAVSSMSINWKNITNLKGIEHFTALTTLSCYENQLTTLDVSNNTALERLDCSDNQLTALDVSANIALETLRCDNNQLNALDVSANTALTELYCPSNQLTELDVRANTALETLRCDINQLNALDVSANTALTYLSCTSNQLSTLVMSNCTALTSLSCSYNQLNALDVSANTALTYLSCFSNQLNALDVSANTALTRLVCSSNQLTSLVVSANTALTDLVCYGNQIQGDEMLALVNSLPTVSSGEFYVVNARNSGMDNIITKSQVAIAMGKRWSVHHSAGDSYYGVEEYALTLGLPTNGTLTATPNGNVGEGTTVVLTAAPEEGYKLKSLKAYMTGDESQAVSISENKFAMPAYDVTVEAEFEAITYTLTYAAGAGGTIQGSATQTVAHGQSGTEVEAVADEGYKLVKWSDNLTTAKRTDSNVQGDINVTAEFELITYTLTYTAGAGGTIVGSAAQTVSHGQSGTEVEAKPNDGYKFVKWSDNLTTAKRTDSNVKANLSVTAEFEKLNTTGISNTKFEALSVYPNPTAGAVQVEATGVVLVYNVASQLLQRVPSQGKVLIDLSAYPAGVYFIRVGNAMAKVMKQ